MPSSPSSCSLSASPRPAPPRWRRSDTRGNTCDGRGVTSGPRPAPPSGPTPRTHRLRDSLPSCAGGGGAFPFRCRRDKREAHGSRVASDPTGQGRAGRNVPLAPERSTGRQTLVPLPREFPGPPDDEGKPGWNTGHTRGRSTGTCSRPQTRFPHPGEGEVCERQPRGAAAPSPNRLGGGGPPPGAEPVATAPSTSTRARWPRGRAPDVP